MVVEGSDYDIFCFLLESWICLLHVSDHFFQNLKNGIWRWLCYLDVCTKWELFGKSWTLLLWLTHFAQCLDVSPDSVSSHIRNIVSLHCLECAQYSKSMPVSHFLVPDLFRARKNRKICRMIVSFSSHMRLWMWIVNCVHN